MSREFVWLGAVVVPLALSSLPLRDAGTSCTTEEAEVIELELVEVTVDGEPGDPSDYADYDVYLWGEIGYTRTAGYTQVLTRVNFRAILEVASGEDEFIEGYPICWTNEQCPLGYRCAESKCVED